MSASDSSLRNAVVEQIEQFKEEGHSLIIKADDGGKSWARMGEVFTRIGASAQSLPPGVYACGISQTGPYLFKVKNDTDSLVVFPDGPTNEVLNEIRHFQTLKALFKKYGFLHKRGILMHGPPGSGKTVTLQLIIDLLVNELGGVALYLESPAAGIACLQMVRAIEPDRQIVCIMEDFDNLIRGNSTSWLALMDGEAQVDNVVFVATTNYPEQLDKRFVDRPSRFDLIKYVGLPTSDSMRVYLRAKVADMSERDIATFAKVAEKGEYTISHLKELVILTHCFGYSIDSAVDRIKKAREAILDSNKGPTAKKPGFSRVPQTIESFKYPDASTGGTNQADTGEDGLAVN